jgi:parallel beta-helix repeat protein
MRFLIMCFVLMFMGMNPAKSFSADWYVATDGNDQHIGTKEQPFATIARARDEVRKYSKTEPVTIWIRGGHYQIPQTLTLNPSDSGTAEAPITYRAFADEKPVLIGGKSIGGWEKWKGDILKADLKAQGIKPLFQQLFYASTRQHLARYPNFDASNPYGGGWAYADGQPIPMYEHVPGESLRTLFYQPQDARTYAKPKDLKIFVFTRYNWWNDIVGVESIDADKRIMKLTKDCSYAIRPGDRYYIQGGLEDLDAPGEWSIDREQGTVYFWPPESNTQTTKLGDPGHEVYVPTLRTLVSVDRAKYITFRGLTLECADECAVNLVGDSHCHVVGCTIRNVSDYNGSGVSVNGGDHNSVVGCDISFVGRNGISLSGGNRQTLTSAENVAENNYIHHFGIYYKQGVAISMTGVGNRASHNLIHDGPRFGIMFSGNNLVIDYNHIRHVNLETEDTGAVYTGGRDWLGSRGTLIKHNYFHDILGYGKDYAGNWISPHFAWGVYLDDNTGGVDVIGNIIARCSRAGIHLHSGRDNHILNNVFINNGMQQFEYNGWKPEMRFWTDHYPTMVKGYESVANEPAWKSMRNMQLHPKDAGLPDGSLMSGNIFEYNIAAWNNEAMLLSMSNVSFAHNKFNKNLYYHCGQPIKANIPAQSHAITDNLLTYGSFDQDVVGKIAAGWNWQCFPTNKAKANVMQDEVHPEQKYLQMDAAFNTEKASDNYPIIITKEFPLKRGASYRLSAKVRSQNPAASGRLLLQSYIPHVYFWAGANVDLHPTAEWKTFQAQVVIPQLGELGYNPEMKQFVVRVDNPHMSAAFDIDDIELVEINKPDAWTDWQQLGNDQESLIADPLFEDFAHDDFRLKLNSPAIQQLGFEPIPVEKIGPYADERRASWPIVEVEGAREKPLVTSSHK